MDKNRSNGKRKNGPQIEACAFCVGPGNLLSFLSSNIEVFVVKCSNCGAIGPQALLPSDAISQWNTRPGLVSSIPNSFAEETTLLLSRVILAMSNSNKVLSKINGTLKKGLGHKDETESLG